MRCPHCGFEDPENYLYCSECGQPRHPTPPPGVPGDRLAGPGGMAGVHPAAAPPARPSAGRPAREQVPTAGEMTTRLLGLEGQVHGDEFVLDRPEMRIGRQPDCDILIPDQSVSRVHAWIRQVPGGYTIEDANSSNGTWVNSRRLSEPHLLEDRDVVRIGNAAFEVRIEASAPRSAPGPMTMVSDLGDDPSPFADEPMPMPNRARATPRPPEPRLPEPRPAGPAAPVASTPSAGRAAGPSDAAAGDLRAELVELERELGPFIERLSALASTVRAMEGRLDERALSRPAGLPASLRALAAELEAHGGLEGYRELQELLDRLRSDPTNVKLLLELSDELPAIERLLHFYSRALSVLRDLERG